MKVTKINEADIADAIENYRGFCTTCCEITRDNTEPDAEGYQCPKCDLYTVIGTEDALMAGLIEAK